MDRQSNGDSNAIDAIKIDTHEKIKHSRVPNWNRMPYACARSMAGWPVVVATTKKSQVCD